MQVLEYEALDKLLAQLRDDGYAVIGPRLVDGVVKYLPVSSLADLPRGVFDRLGPGHYLTEETDSPHLFAYTPGPEGLKPYLYPSREVVYTAAGDENDFKLEIPSKDYPRYAFLGVRPCDLHAVAILDKVLMDGPHPDPGYTARRSAACFIAVNCSHPADTCFCESTGTGPGMRGLADMALTEVVHDSQSIYGLECFTPTGNTLLNSVARRDATPDEYRAIEQVKTNAREQLQRGININEVRDALLAYGQESHWDDVAKRCLACANCTMSCPTCFCNTMEDTTNLTGSEATRTRVWDSCFTLDFSYIHGGSIRESGGARYRHWITHKLGTWREQFGTGGCVGCGRCIAWCPVGIDITEEAENLVKHEHKNSIPLAR